jgi:galactokinase
VADNLHPKYTRQTFVPARKLSVSGSSAGKDIPEDAVHVEQWHLGIDPTQLRWESYVKAGYYGVLNHYFAPGDSNNAGGHPVPVDILVTGSVPAGSGLSSSAAMVVASTLAFLAVNGKLDDTAQAASEGLNKGKLVEMSMENEKRVGVNSGGMDQAASVISLAGSALYISFFPRLSAQPIPLPGAAPTTSTSPASAADADSALPPRAVFVCANSLVVSDKVVHARTRYNLRVVETLVSARVLARRLGVSVGDKEKVTLREVLGRVVGEDVGKMEDMDLAVLKGALEKMVKEVEVLKPQGRDEEGVTMEEMIEWSGMSKDVFDDVYLSWVDIEATRFQLYKRAKHVFTESLRVLQFRDVCIQSNAAAESASSTAATLKALGALMNESQESCSKVFDCSCPELDELVQLARDAGAYGSRLTGAGWGGCTVSLVDENKVDEFIAKVKASYGPYKELEGTALHEVIFATKPSSGACVYKFED